MPIIGENEFLFGKEFTDEEAWHLVDLGKKTTQAKKLYELSYSIR